MSTITTTPDLIKQDRFSAKDEMIRQSILDPVLFTKAWLQVQPWQKQQDILYDIFNFHKVAVKSCHASGKSFTAACAVLGFLAKYKKSVVITTAPTARQVCDVLWKQIRSLAAFSKYPFPEPTQVTLTLSPSRYAIGFTTSVTQGDLGAKFQGYHSENILVIADEAAGVDAQLFGAIEGILSAGNSHLLIIGNPTISSGTFYDAFGQNRSVWKTHTISAFDTPNFRGLNFSYKTLEGKEVTIGTPTEQGGKDIRSLSDKELDVAESPYLIGRRWFLERLVEWGPTHPLFVSRCLGMFPAQAPDALMSIDWLEAAKWKTLEIKSGEKFGVGIDVAGPGEAETVMVVRRGGQIVEWKAWPQPDPRGELLAHLLPYKEHLDYVNVDVCGIGYYLARHLEDAGFPVCDINVGETPDDNTRYVNLKAEAYWGLRMWLAAGDVCGLDDEVTMGQLASIRYKTNSRGQIVIESKEEAAKRGVASPDRAEALMLAFARPRLHGLVSYWEQLADEQAAKKVIPVQTPVLTDTQSLAAAQKESYGYKTTPPTRPGQRQIELFDLPDACLRCGNQTLAIYAEGVWSCGGCGAKGVERRLVN